MISTEGGIFAGISFVISFGIIGVLIWFRRQSRRQKIKEDVYLGYRARDQLLPVEPSIRLLTIEAGVKNVDGLVCSLSPVALHEAPPYEALSYVWGNPQDTKQITCSGSKVAVTANLYSALHFLQKPFKSRVLWIDALCIDQSNHDERAEQVRLMAKIYRQATRTIIWIGEESRADDGAFTYIKSLNQSYHQHKMTDSELSILVETTRMCLLNTLPREAYSAGYSPSFLSTGPAQGFVLATPRGPVSATQFLALFQRPWFKRLWVLQEVVKSQQAVVKYGPYEVPWIAVTDLVSRIFDALPTLRFASGLQKLPNELVGMANVRVMASIRSSATADPFRTLFLARTFDCTDPRDRIYALLGLIHYSKIEDHNQGKPDYTSDDRQTFRNHMTFMLEQAGTLDALSMVRARNGDQASSTASDSWPSWLPDWTQEYADMPFHAHHHGGINSNLTKPTVTINDLDELHILGKPLDIIQRVGTLSHGLLDPKPSLKLAQPNHKDFFDNGTLMQAWLEECFDVSGILRFDLLSFLETIASNDFVRILGCDDKKQLNKSKEMHLKYVRQTLRHLLSPIYPRPAIDVDLNADFLYSTDHLFCKTTHGRLGWVPKATQSGDIICVFHGGRFPFILRRLDNGKYRLLGDCWIDGLSKAEDLREMDVEDETFVIC